MITIDTVTKGLRDGAVRIVDSPNGDGAVCRIGECWFYFGGNEAEGCSGEEYAASVPESDLAREIHETLEGFREAPDTYGDEYAYYDAVLTERQAAKITEGI